MYSLAAFKKDLGSIFWFGFLGFAILFGLLMIDDGGKLARAWDREPLAVVGMCLALFAIAAGFVFAIHLLRAIPHRGWSRILTLISVVSFVIPIYVETTGYGAVDANDIAEGLVGSMILVAAVVVGSLGIYGLFSWVKKGFDEPSDDDVSSV